MSLKGWRWQWFLNQWLDATPVGVLATRRFHAVTIHLLRNVFISA
jgi:hypothetical protein